MSAASSEDHPFVYRSPRVGCCLPVEYVTEQGTLCGIATNISDQGLLVQFHEPVSPQLSGRSRIRVEHCLLELAGQVTHTDAFEAGISFLFSSERERHFVHAIVQALAAAL